MQYLSDLHTHSLVSGHAYSTLLENVSYCSKNGIKILGTSEHGPKMPGAPHIWYFNNLRAVPRIIDNVIILRGCEANILNTNGDIDLTGDATDSLDYIIGSFHEILFNPSSKEENTTAVINAIENNEKLEILGHMGNPSYELDYEAIVKKVKEKNIMIEMNNSSLKGHSRSGSITNCEKLALLCIKYGAKVILNSDAHFSTAICDFEKSHALMEKVNMPKELIMNDPEKLIAHFKSKGRLQDLNI